MQMRRMTHATNISLHIVRHSYAIFNATILEIANRRRAVALHTVNHRCTVLRR